MTTIFPNVIAHRGASAGAPENTMVAFELAVEVGAKALEFDVTVSADGVAIVFHDEVLDRTTDGTGPVALKSWDELQTLDAGGWLGDEYKGIKIPSLKQVLDFADERKLVLNLEIKPTLGLEGPTVGAIVSTLQGRDIALVVSSFNERALGIFHTQMPDVEVAYLTEVIPADWGQRVKELGAQAVHCGDSFVTENLVREITNSGYGVRVFTVNEPERAKQLWSWGVESIFSDCPDKFIGIK